MLLGEREDGRSCTAVFCKKLVATRTQDMRLWIWIAYIHK